MDRRQAFLGDPGVDAGGVEVAVSEQLLDVADVGSRLDHEGGGTVAEEVAAAGLAHAGALDVAADGSGEPGRPQALAVGGEEHRPGIVADRTLSAA